MLLLSWRSQATDLPHHSLQLQLSLAVHACGQQQAAPLAVAGRLHRTPALVELQWQSRCLHGLVPSGS